VLVGHDAFPAGAQLLLLNLAKTLVQQFGFDLKILLCGKGDLLPAYREVAPTSVCASKESMSIAVKQLRAEGFHSAITNSVASGSAVGHLKGVGVKVLSLVHEMPKLISEYHLHPQAKMVAMNSDEVLFPSAIVRDVFVQAIGPVANTASVRPQGIYNRVSRVAGARESLREELGLPADSRIVVNVGYGDLRKGIDLFCETARLVEARRPEICFVWVGDVHPLFKNWVTDSRANKNVRFVGPRQDIGRILSGADAFVLTSREDPYPSVVLEALSIGVPVLAFRDAGGFVDLLEEEGFGRLVAYCDPNELGDAVIEEIDRKTDGILDIQQQKVSAEITKRFSFDSYAFDLAERLDSTLKRVSVIVPNYNYGRYLAERLKSIFDQTYPVFEIIVLDDNSTDDSLDIVKGVTTATRRQVTLIRNEENSGSVFEQWRKGVELARGDLVWIAEADDLSDPKFLDRMLQFFENPEVGLAFSDSRTIDEEGKPLKLRYKEYYDRIHSGALARDLVEDAADFAKRYLSQRNTIMNVSAVLWRRDRLAEALASERETLNTYKLAGDWHVYLLACRAGGKIGYCAELLNAHRRHREAVTRRTPVSLHFDEIRRLHSLYNKLFGEDLESLRQQKEYLRELGSQFGLPAPDPNVMADVSEDENSNADRKLHIVIGGKRRH
jgi:glycosyltransferase involved in cell wall biosynthesis